jgi:hypothetical protein
MTPHEARLAELSARADLERRDLAMALEDFRIRVDRKRERWSSAGFWAATLTAGATSAFRLFGRRSFSARVNRWSTVGTILVAVARFLFRLFR